MNAQNIYDYSATTLQGKQQSFAEYRGKLLLIVNTASKCGLTPQYQGLEELYRKYKDQGLLVLGFPCNQFAQQEPGDAASISEVCQINYGVSFPMFAKIDVNGPNTHPVYQFLRQRLGGWFGNSIKWNFTKFLVDRNGVPVKRYAPFVKPESLEIDIRKHLLSPTQP